MKQALMHRDLKTRNISISLV